MISMLNIFKLLKKGNKLDIFDWIIRICLSLIVFFVPIFFLPFNADYFELNKTFFFGLLVIIASITHIVRIIVKKEGVFLKTFFDWFFLFLLLVYIASTVFSVNRLSSLWGIDNYYSGGLASLILFILFFYLIINNIKSKGEILGLLVIFLISSGILIIFNLFQLNGVYLLPLELAKTRTFNALINSVEILSVFLSLSCFLLFGLFLYVKNLWPKIGLLLGFLANLSILFLLDKNISWIILGAGVFVFLILIARRSRELRSFWIISPTIFLTIVILLIFFNSQNLTHYNLPNDVMLNQKTAWTVAIKTIAKSPVWGTGPATFAYNFEKYRTIEFNNSSLWNWRFIKSSDEWSQLFSTSGLLAGILFFVICLLYIINSFSVLIKVKKPDYEWFLTTIVFLAWLLVFVSGFIISYNFVLSFAFWFLMALGVNLGRRQWVKNINFSLTSSGRLSLIFTVIFLLLICGGVIYAYSMAKIWLGDFYSLKTSQAIEKTQDLSSVKNYLNKAIDYNPQKSNYYFTFAQALATEVQLEAMQTSPDLSKIQTLVAESVEKTKMAVKVDKKNPLVYENQAMIYQALYPYLDNTFDLAKQSYEEALKFESQNPMVYLNLGQIRLLSVQEILKKNNLSDEEKKNLPQIIDQAIADLEKSKQLKSDFMEADYYLATALELKGEKEKAIEKMKTLADAYPSDVTILYTLGVMYIDNNQLTEAQATLNRVVNLRSNHANAHFYLGIIYEQQGEIDKAISELEIVQELNPDNETVKQKLDDLKSKKTAAETPSKENK